MDDNGKRDRAGESLPPAAELLPHRPPMLLVRELLERGPGRLRCRGQVAADSPLARDGRAPAMLAVELAAQGAALLEALERGDREGDAAPRRGYLISLQRLELGSPTLPAGEPLDASVVYDGGAGPLARYRIRVRGAGGELYAAGVIGTYALPADEQQPAG